MNKAHIFRLQLLSVLLVSALTACGSGGGGGSGGSSTDIRGAESDTTQYFAEYGDLYSGKPYLIRYPVTAESVKSADTPEVSAEYGEVSSVHPFTGEPAPSGTVYYYVPENKLNSMPSPYSLTEKFTVVYGDGSRNVFTLELGTKSPDGDPLFAEQWHLKNVGQNPYSVKISPVEGIDLNVIPAWRMTDANGEHITGKDVKIAVLDTGIDFRHEDLSDRKYTPSVRASFINQDFTLTDVIYNETMLHGTKVAGIMAATAGNGKGVRGIAYDAQLTAYHKDNTNFTYLTRHHDVNTINASIAMDSSYVYSPEKEAFFEAMFENGIPFIRAAGNEYGDVSFRDGTHYPLNCVSAKADCQFNQTSSFNRGRYVIIAGALNSMGTKSSYGSTGSHLWVTGMAGEFGYNGKQNSSAAIVTTKYSHEPYEYQDLRDGNTPWRNDKDKYKDRRYYTHTMNGTSSGAPSVTGVSALILQAKPDVTVPQIRYILASTANSDTTPGWSSLEYSAVESRVTAYGGSMVTHDPGWFYNGAGLRFSNRYGFGVVNAAKAVSKALYCDEDEYCSRRSELPSDYVSTNDTPCSSDDGGRNITCSFTDFESMDNNGPVSPIIEIEDIAVNVSSLVYDDDTDSGKCIQAANAEQEGIAHANSLLQIEMKSPDGTTSLIKSVYANWDFNARAMHRERPSFSYDTDFMIYTSAFYAEHASADDSFILNIRSACPVDVDNLNRSIRVKIGGYAL